MAGEGLTSAALGNLIGDQPSAFEFVSRVSLIEICDRPR